MYTGALLPFLASLSCTFTLGADFSSLEAWDHNRLEEYIPTITYEAESPDEAALVEVIYMYMYTCIIMSIESKCFAYVPDTCKQCSSDRALFSFKTHLCVCASTCIYMYMCIYVRRSITI